MPPPCGHLALVEWQITPTARDAGVPGEVIDVLAATLVSAGRVTFPCSSVASIATGVWQASNDDFIRRLPCKSWLPRLYADWRQQLADIPLLSTRNRDRARMPFDDPAFPWWLQGQIVLLSAPDRSPPEIDRATLLSLFADDWAARFAALADTAITGVMRPGVDGDVAALLFRSAKQKAMLIDALERETRRAGFTWASEAS